jgi:hypothetical protein
MSKILLAALAACLAGPGALAAAGLLSATGNVIAILAGDLFVGEAEGHLSGGGTLAIRSQKASGPSCLGQFTSSAKLGGSGQMRCSDGTTATFQFRRLSIFSGHGVGNSSRGPISFVYGLAADEVGPYLRVPEGRKLTFNGTELELADLQDPR